MDTVFQSKNERIKTKTKQKKTKKQKTICFIFRRCSYSPVLKTRVMAARALEPLVEKDHVTRVFNDLLTLLPSDSLQRIKQNHIHGVLLQVGNHGISTISI